VYPVLLSIMTGRILSIDVGSKNMVFCNVGYMNHPPYFDISHWFFLNCHGGSISDMVEKCIAQLDILISPPVLENVSLVLIESQPAKTIKMKTLSHCIQTYFVMSKKKVAFANPHNKLKLCDPALIKKGCYAKNKNASIAKCAQLLGQYKDSGFDRHGFYENFNSHQKKDDLADSLLQALYVLLFQPGHQQQESQSVAHRTQICLDQ
jgi:hypothetical protein